ncbi:hypothetical protein [Cupriavidus consociatus]|uniref:hypothetical protein n=1 Tax=Cupriavidus consociatus TaxID=2821357 RepID=UPI001AE58434|nr:MULTISPECIES: hypothetical protein [unclassified Cupriavidus]MBP0624985.1 hypothetical protein [Cupriavidus sp. LEh25]MDK2661718.1 hypothetical protein [Cupriavidus sp. LEh21]
MNAPICYVASMLENIDKKSMTAENRNDEKADVDQKEYFEFLCKEYFSINDRIASLTASSFEDFKLLGVVGAIFAWLPIAKSFEQLQNPAIIFFGFMAISVIVSVIDARDLLKHSLVRFYLQQLEYVETEILLLVKRENDKVLHGARNWPAWLAKKHGRLVNLFQYIVHGFVIIFPAITLFYLKAAAWGAAYFICSVFLANFIAKGYENMRAT